MGLFDAFKKKKLSFLTSKRNGIRCGICGHRDKLIHPMQN